MERTFRDLALALRALRISPGFTLATISTLALGIGANAAVFSVVNGVLIKPLPYRQPAELIHARYTAPGIGFPEFGLSGLDYVQFNERARSVTDFAVFAVQNVDLAGDNEEPERLAAAQTSGNFFDVLGIPPRIGRTLQPDDELGASADVVVLSHAFWVRRFGVGDFPISLWEWVKRLFH